jgi:hypothetical protein
MQVDKELPVGKAVPQNMRGMHRQGSLADSRHSADRTDGHYTTRTSGTRHGGRDLPEFHMPASEYRRIRRQRISHPRDCWQPGTQAGWRRSRGNFP